MRKDSNPVLWPDELSHTVTTASFPYQEHGSQSCPSQSTVLAILGYLMTPSRLTPTRLPPHGPPVCQGHFSDQHQLSESVLNPHSDQLLITPATISTVFFSPLSPILQPNQEIFFHFLPRPPYSLTFGFPTVCSISII